MCGSPDDSPARLRTETAVGVEVLPGDSIPCRCSARYRPPLRSSSAAPNSSVRSRRGPPPQFQQKFRGRGQSQTPAERLRSSSGQSANLHRTALLEIALGELKALNRDGGRRRRPGAFLFLPDYVNRLTADRLGNGEKSSAANVETIRRSVLRMMDRALSALAAAWVVSVVATTLLVAALAAASVWDTAIFLNALRGALSRIPFRGTNATVIKRRGVMPRRRGRRYADNDEARLWLGAAVATGCAFGHRQHHPGSRRH